MNFDASAERRMLVETIARYLKDRYPGAASREGDESGIGWSREHWGRFAELGVIGALFSPEHGGFGGSGHDVAAVFDSLGRAIVVEPFLGTLMAGRLLALTGNTGFLAQVIAGETVVLAADQHEGITIGATGTQGEWNLSGAIAVIPQLASADAVLLAASTPSGPSLFLVERGAAGCEIRDYRLIDGGRGGDLLLERAPARLLGTQGQAAELVEATTAAGVLALCSEAVGIMDSLRDQTLDYLRTRHQFGVPIGSFQALKHRMAVLALEIEQARSAVFNAAAALDGDRIVRERTASAAKFTVGRVGTLVAEEAIQLHGGIGMTWELPLSHFAKRLIMIGHQFGDEDYHLDRYIGLGTG